MNKKFTENELTEYNKDILITLLLSQQQLNTQLTETVEFQKQQLQELNQKMDILIEQLSISKQQRFGRSTEKIDLDEQLGMCFNEAEVTIANKLLVEPAMEEIVSKPSSRKKQKGKREEDLKDIPVKIIEHTLSEEELKTLLGDNWRRLPDDVYKRLTFVPAKFEVEEHHVAVYAGNDNETIIRADRPVDLLRNSVATPSLVAAIMNYKYINALPIYRLEQEFARNDVRLGRNTMASWVIKSAERYFSLLFDRMHQELFHCGVIQADETPVEVSKDGRPAGSKSYMWVYRTGKMYDAPPIVLYEYQKTRNSSHPKQFLKGYKGTLVTDGYQVYHKMARENPDIEVAGCWSHARRRFANVVKSLGKEAAKGTLASDALGQIALIYKTDNGLSELTPKERLHKRQLLVKPLVEAFFEWVKQHYTEVPKNSETGKGFTYCINQEHYLKNFLKNGSVPLDNNATESTIRGFCIGKKNWRLIDTVNGAKSSAIVYSIAETAKANNLKPYEYFKYLLDEIPKYMDDKNLNFLDNLLPWAEALPEKCKRINQ